jgi:hypothetical protein
LGQSGNKELKEVALFIPNGNRQEGYLREVGFFISRFSKYKTPFRIRIYEPDGDMPGKDLLIESLVTHGSRGNRFCFMDVSKYNIPFGKKGIFISMEWLNLSDKKYFYEVTNRKTRAVRTFYGQQIGLTDEFEDSQGRIKMNNKEWKIMKGFNAPTFRAKIDFYVE